MWEFSSLEQKQSMCILLCIESKMSCFPTGEIVQIMDQKNVSMKDVAEVAVDSL